MRVLLREALKAALEKTYDKPFTFGTGFLEDLNSETYRLPLVWLCPFELIGKTGVCEGSKTYAGTIYLLEAADGLTSKKKDERWDVMEQAALSAQVEVIDTHDLIVSFEKTRCFPNEGAYTGYNDLSLKVTFEVTTIYCECRG